METIRTGVLVVGAGPAGLAAGLLLQRQGCDALTITRYGWTAHTPRAHHINPRAMELLRGLGLEQAVRRRAFPQGAVRNVVWCVSLAGREIGRLEHYHSSGPGGYHDSSPCDPANIAQHNLEPILAEELLRRGGKLLFNMDCLAVEQDEGGVRATVRNRATGETVRIEADYLVGADGANSLVARDIGLELDGPAGWGAAINVWIRADLSRYVAHRPGALFWTNQPGSPFWIGSGVFVAVEPWDQWMVTFMYDPAGGEPDLDHDVLVDRIRHIVGDPDVAVEILHAGTWLMNAQVARSYSRGRVFCVGDAVHRHSPANGLGANTSMLDAYNLAWKLDLVQRGVADPALLETYGVERQPIGAAVIARSMKSVGEFPAVAAALGYAPGQTVAEGQACLDLLSAPGEAGEQVRARVAEAFALQAYQFSAAGFELGYHYPEGAVVDCGVAYRPSADPDLIHRPQVCPGAVLPHARLVGRDGVERSTLDIVSDGGFHLLTGPGGEGWRDVCRAVADRFGLDIGVSLIGPGGDHEDSYQAWRGLRETGDSGAILVRPDTHVAWMAPAFSTEAGEELARGVAALLGRSS
ncbi:FAD-dependent monooxygenase [Rhizorhabdus wittichii]|uniref:FAD-dependent monooxygenase n=1 Tax=Rhizorhabdus wittichii TaxID=160791 RepID=UPI000319D6ED|nr:FAD-dependent monooxygenase [Rhizorhabdus wittichii]